MSMNLIDRAKKFLNGDIAPQIFSDEYIKAWNNELDANILKDDEANLSECASTIFILADSFNPESDRSEGELDENGFKAEVKATLEKFKLS